MPLVSIVIPAYNAASFIGEAIESLINQTHRPLNIIVVNDGSSDNTSIVARNALKFAQDDLLFGEVIDLQENKGPGYALDLGFKAAKGDYIGFLAADDLYANPAKLAIQVAEMEKAGSGWSYWSAMLHGPSINESIRIDTSFVPHLSILDNFIVSHPKIMFIALLFHNPINSSSILLAKEYRDIWDPELRANCDGDILLKLGEKGVKGSVIRGLGVFYRDHPNQVSKNISLMQEAIDYVQRRAVTNALQEKKNPLWFRSVLTIFNWYLHTQHMQLVNEA